MADKCGHKVTESVELSEGGRLTTYVSQLSCQRSPHGNKGYHQSSSGRNGIAWDTEGIYHDRNEKVGR